MGQRQHPRNPEGFPQTLVAAHPANENAVKSGVYSRSGQPYAGRAAEISEWLMSAGHITAQDEVAAAEVGRLIALIERMDDTLSKKITTNGGGARGMLDLRLRASGRLASWLSQLGLVPRARAELMAMLAQGGLAAEISRRREAAE